jgi:hypothetical protein
MFTVYAEKEIFEEIVLYNEKYPNWYSIFRNHAEICLNLTKEELMLEEIPDTPIFEFYKATGGKSLIPLNEYFQSIYDNNAEITNKPRAAFFLEVTPEQASDMQNKFGIIVQSSESINDRALTGSFYKNLLKDMVYEDGTRSGWQHLMNFNLPPSNAMVISDNYLFAHTEKGQNIGKANFLNMANAILPANLEIPYHIIIFANDNPDKNHQTAKALKWCEKISRELKSELSDLRPYEIIVEVVFTSTLHRRKLILNYVNATADSGFAVFNINDHKTVRSNNDFRFDSIFSDVINKLGDTDFKTAESVLAELKKKAQSLHEYLKNADATVNHIILGDCKSDKSIRNRLINDA